MEMKLCNSNTFKTTNVSKLTKTILESSNRLYKLHLNEKHQNNPSVFKGRWVLAYFWHSNGYNFGYIFEKVAKVHFLESPQKSLETRQHLY